MEGGEVMAAGWFQMMVQQHTASVHNWVTLDSSL